MEAKDTLMKEGGKRECVFTDKGNYRTPWSIADHTAKKQAERTESMLKEQWKQEGRREVVEWVKDELFKEPTIEDYTRWQKKLKEWGL